MLVISIIFAWWLIGLIIVLVAEGDSILTECKNKEVSISIAIIGIVLISFVGPLLSAYGMIKTTLDLLKIQGP